MTFALEISDHNKIDQWLHSTVYPQMLKEQIDRGDTEVSTDSMGRPIPYLGAIGGLLTFQFTPTSLGTVVKVTAGNHVLDLTDYESW